MTSSPLSAAPADPPVLARRAPAGGLDLAVDVADLLGLGDSVAVAYLLTCFRCAPDVAAPYPSEVERDAEAVRHVERLGHAVLLCTDGVPEADRRPVVLLSDVGAPRVWRWICTPCAWRPGTDLMSEPHGSGQLALADFRRHLTGGQHR